MILVAVIVMTFFHPGYCLKYQNVRQQQLAPSDIGLAVSNSPKESTDRSRLGV
jgi:hypothetical protein